MRESRQGSVGMHFPDRCESIALCSPCLAQAQGDHPWPPVDHMRSTLGRCGKNLPVFHAPRNAYQPTLRAYCHSTILTQNPLGATAPRSAQPAACRIRSVTDCGPRQSLDGRPSFATLPGSGDSSEAPWGRDPSMGGGHVRVGRRSARSGTTARLDAYALAAVRGFR
jgi:hypothetical protein